MKKHGAGVKFVLFIVYMSCLIIYFAYASDSSPKMKEIKEALVAEMTDRWFSDAEKTVFWNGDVSERTSMYIFPNGTLELIRGTYTALITDTENGPLLSWEEEEILSDELHQDFEIKSFFGRLSLKVGDENYHLYRDDGELEVEFYNN